MLQEEVQLWVAAGVHSHLEQRPEDVLEHLLEVTQLLLCVVDVTVRREERRQQGPSSSQLLQIMIL